MPKALPVRPNLEHLKSQAKDLLEAFRRGDSEARARFRASLPSAHAATPEALAAMSLALHDAQSVIAREYGFASFAELRVHVEAELAARPPGGAVDVFMKAHRLAPPLEVLRAIREASAAPSTEAPLALAASLPIVPLRDALLTPGAIAPLQVGRPTSIAAVDFARQHGGMLGVFTQKDLQNEAPVAGDLHPIGCQARLLATVPTDHTTWIVVRAVSWIRLVAIDQTSPLLLATVEGFTVEEGDRGEVARLETRLRERMRSALAALPDRDVAQGLLRMTERMKAGELADAAVANLPATVETKARYAGEANLTRRLELALAMFALPA